MKIHIPEGATPPFFDLSAYESASSLNLKGWYHNLNERAWIQSFLKHISKNEEFEQHYSQEELDKWLAKLLNKPIITGYGYEGEVERDFAASSRVVEPVSLKDVMDINADVRNGFWGNHLREMANIFNTPNSEQGVEAEEELDRHSVVIKDSPPKGDEIDPIAWLSVDLNSKDQEIEKSFRMWLEKARRDFPEDKTSSKRQRKLKSFSRSTLQKWYSNRILPYLDLMLWNERVGINLTDEMVGAVIFPEQGGGRKRKVIAIAQEQ